MLLLSNCEVHTGSIRTEVLKYGPNEFEPYEKLRSEYFPVWTGGINWSIRALLYSHDQRQKIKAFSKFRAEHICIVFEYSS